MKSALISPKTFCSVLLASAMMLPAYAQASGDITIFSLVPGKTPFLATLQAIFGNTISSVSMTINPKPGSFTRPIVATYSASYLQSKGISTSGFVNLPIFGLYAGYNNSITIAAHFVDGSSATASTTLLTSSYTDPCSQLSAPTFQQNRKAISDLSYDYFLLKDGCSTNSPIIYDTDGNVRWVSTAGVATYTSTFFNNAIFQSDGHTGLETVDLPTGTVVKVADYSSSQQVTTTSEHNIDYGRNGMLLDVNTAGTTESVVLEVDKNGQVLNKWDFGQIISYRMTSFGGEDPAKFISNANDWFHNNSNTYNPADNTLIVSSRENFVMAVDYDTPPDGQKKIHWILGDQTKHWYQFPSLSVLSLYLEPNTTPPIGQHAVSIGAAGNLLLYNDGAPSIYQQPAGRQLPYSTTSSYVIDTNRMTAQQYFSYTPQQQYYSPYCGSIYDVGGYHLFDAATANLSSTNNGIADIRGLGYNTNALIFELLLPETQTCGVGWNAVPLNLNALSF